MYLLCFTPARLPGRLYADVKLAHQVERVGEWRSLRFQTRARRSRRAACTSPHLDRYLVKVHNRYFSLFSREGQRHASRSSAPPAPREIQSR